MKRGSKILVLGASGLVGSAIVRKLLEKGYKNIAGTYKTRNPRFEGIKLFQVDFTNQKETEKFFEQFRPEYVFFAAAKVGGILANNTYKADFIYENMAIAVNVIHTSYTYGVKKLLNLGSSCIYPRHSPQPMKEGYLLTGPLEPTNEPYALAKISAIKLCRYFNDQYGTNFISAMPTNLYGPEDNFNLETSHVLPALIRKFHLAKLLEKGDLEGISRDLKKYPVGFELDGSINISDKTNILKVLHKLGIEFNQQVKKFNHVSVKLWGSGEVYREFLYIDDLADACVFLMEKVNAWDLSPSHPAVFSKHHSTNLDQPLNLPDYFINVGTGCEIKIKDLAMLIKEVTGFKGDIAFDPSKPDGMPRKLLDVSNINKLGWKAKIGLKEGIKITYERYKDN